MQGICRISKARENDLTSSLECQELNPEKYVHVEKALPPLPGAMFHLNMALK